MDFVITTKGDFHLSVQKMIRENEVYGVKRRTPSFSFDKLFAADELCLDHDTTLLPPNQYLLPPKDPLITFDLEPEPNIYGKMQAVTQIILGIHSYDLHAVKLLDAVFTGNLIDGNYQSRRTATVFVGVDCLIPWPYSFAASMGTALPPKIFDLWLTDLGDEYLVEIGSSHGYDLIERYIKTRRARHSHMLQREKLRQEAVKKYQLSLRLSPKEIPKVLDKGWGSTMWEELGQKCFSCGSCTMVCPTCVCFDVRDRVHLDLEEGERYRSWDSCMFDGFAKVASGENFRPTGTDRLRHRLYRKGKYMLERWGELGCVGCGRCVHACLVDIASPVYAYNRLVEEMS
jgi:ferredoxin